MSCLSCLLERELAPKISRNRACDLSVGKNLEKQLRGQGLGFVSWEETSAQTPWGPGLAICVLGGELRPKTVGIRACELAFGKGT